MRTKANFAAAVSEFVDSFGGVVRRIRAQSNVDGLSWTESSVLARLAREGATTTAELARIQGIKPQSMGAVVASLEKQGLISRKAHETDGRQMLLEVTAKGEALWKERKAARRTWLAEAMQELSEEDQETVFAAGKILDRLARENR